MTMSTISLFVNYLNWQWRLKLTLLKTQTIFPVLKSGANPPPLIPADTEEEEDEIVTLGFLKKLVDENKISVECHTPNCKHE